jgi:hypothetical protein
MFKIKKIHLPHPKWSIYIALISALIIGGGMFLLAIKSHNYCNEFCKQFMCNADNHCNQINWLHLIKYFLSLFLLTFFSVFMPAYAFQILDYYIKDKK